MGWEWLEVVAACVYQFNGCSLTVLVPVGDLPTLPAEVFAFLVGINLLEFGFLCIIAAASRCREERGYCTCLYDIMYTYTEDTDHIHV